MKNSFFQFKQFIIHQERSSMKVCTDSCLFGAWIARILEDKQIQPTTILDIGTGTGLLSLMLSQKTNASIDAIEINQLSFEDAKANFAVSPWTSRLQAYLIDIKDYQPTNQYDLIITNPPFFEKDLLSSNSEKNIAKHDAGLTLENLLLNVIRLLKPTGQFAVLLPFNRLKEFISLAEKNELVLQEKMLARQTSDHSFFRGLLLFGKEAKPAVQKEITIKDNDNEYTRDFVRLLGDYYLKL
ncbi:MAG: methyltransferase [Ginsengibacter sp.]